MTSILRNFGPLAAFSAAVAWLCCEQLNPPDAAPDLGPQKVTRIDQKLLEPQFPSPCARNPLVPAAPPAPESAGRTLGTVAGEIGAGPTPLAEVPLPAHLKLRGTYVGGLRKSALIDDRLCFEGDCLPRTEAGAPHPWRLTQVERDYVVLRMNDKEFRLQYSP